MRIKKITGIKDVLLLKNGLICIATRYSGIFIVDIFGNVKNHLYEHYNLQVQVVARLFEDQIGNLWLAMQNGIGRLEINSPISHMAEKYELTGTVEAITRYNDDLYAATVFGVYKLNASSENPAFVPVKGLDDKAWDILAYETRSEKMLIAALDNGIFAMAEKDSVEQIVVCAPWTITQSVTNPARIFIGVDNDGVISFLRKDGKWIDEGPIEGVNGSVRNILELEDGTLFLSAGDDGTYKLNTKMLFEQNLVKIMKLDLNNGLPKAASYPILINNELIFGTTNGFYSLNNETSQFMREKKYGDIFYNGDRAIHRFSEDYEDNVWIVSYIERNGGNEIELGYLKQLSNGSYTWISNLFKGISDEIKHDFFHDNNKITWIGGTDGLYRVDNKVNLDTINSSLTLIRKVIIGRDSVLFGGSYKGDQNIVSISQPLNAVPELDYKFNSLVFHYAIQSKGNKLDNQYQYYLEGYEDSWGNWTKAPWKEYSNLLEGEYTLHVIGKNLYNSLNKEATYKFRIKPPWYRTILAYVAYLILLVGMLLLVIRVYALRLRAKNIRLEKIIKDRTAEIQEKNKELEKLSIVASETDNSVIISDAEGNIEWVNEGFTRLFGYTLDEYKNKYGHNLIRQDSEEHIIKAISKCMHKNESTVFTSHTTDKKGIEMWVQTTLTPIMNSSGKLTKLISIGSDVTKVEKAKAEISELFELAVARKDEIEKQRDHIVEQKEHIEEQQKEILDSIIYAKRIQEAMLPTNEFLDRELKYNFILFRPKDVVSGDFYWATKINKYVIVAVADCTGHGVPGAFMSMLGITFLNEIVSKSEITFANQALNELRKYIITALKQKGEVGEQKDGMDMALSVLNTEDNSLQFAGSNNPLWMIRAKDARNIDAFEKIEDVITEIKPDKMPVAIYVKMDSFTNHEIQLEKGDSIYMFSDGLPDQFGGPNGKKFKYRPFKQILVENQNRSMPGQKKLLEEKLDEWMAYHDPVTGHAFEQIDDICVIGIRI